MVNDSFGLGLLRIEPSEEIIEAISSIPDDECMVLLRRIARSEAELSPSVPARMKESIHSCATAIAISIRALLP